MGRSSPGRRPQLVTNKTGLLFEIGQFTITTSLSHTHTPGSFLLPHLRFAIPRPGGEMQPSYLLCL